MLVLIVMLHDEVINRVFRQHNSLVITVPVALQKLLDIRKGDYVYFTWPRARKDVRFGKVVLRKGRKNGSSGHSDRKHR